MELNKLAASGIVVPLKDQFKNLLKKDQKPVVQIPTNQDVNMTEASHEAQQPLP